MILTINTLKNLKSNESVYNIVNIKEISDSNEKLQNEIKNNEIEGIIFITDDILKNIKLIVFLMDIDVTLIVVIPNKIDYQKNLRFENILGVPIIQNIKNIPNILNKKYIKNTIPHLNNSIEKAINLIEKQLKENKNVKRYIAMQIIYENPYYLAYLKNTNIKIIKENLDYILNGKTIDIIDDTINLIK